MKRSFFVTVTAMALVLAMSSSAFAHFCYVVNRSDRGARMAAGSPAWISIREVLVEEIGLCRAGVRHVLDGIEAMGLPRTLMIHGRTVMAQGLFHHNHHKLQDGRGIDHLTEAQFVAFEGLVGDAFGICGGG